MLDSGFLTVGSFRGAPVRLHWTIAIGALLFGGFRFAPVFWAAFFGLVLLHEIGHAIIVRRYGHRVHAIDVTGFGGLCRWSGAASPFERSAIAWGGVLAQGVVLGSTLAAIAILGSPTATAGTGPSAAQELVHVFTRTNLMLIALNLVPVPPLDGAEAWPLFRHWNARRKEQGRLRAAQRARRQKAQSDRAASDAAHVGSVGDGGRPKTGNRATDEALAKMFEQIADEARRTRRGE